MGNKTAAVREVSWIACRQVRRGHARPSVVALLWLCWLAFGLGCDPEPARPSSTDVQSARPRLQERSAGPAGDAAAADLALGPTRPSTGARGCPPVDPGAFGESDCGTCMARHCCAEVGACRADRSCRSGLSAFQRCARAEADPFGLCFERLALGGGAADGEVMLVPVGQCLRTHCLGCGGGGGPAAAE